jgi:Na+/glutamate symporter
VLLGDVDGLELGTLLGSRLGKWSELKSAMRFRVLISGGVGVGITPGTVLGILGLPEGTVIGVAQRVTTGLIPGSLLGEEFGIVLRSLGA